MTDIVERLRKIASEKRKIFNCPIIEDAAADKIERLIHDLSGERNLVLAFSRANKKLRKEIERLNGND